MTNPEIWISISVHGLGHCLRSTRHSLLCGRLQLRRGGLEGLTRHCLEGDFRCWNDLECQKKGIKNAKWIMNSVISMISFQNRRVCVLSSLLEVTTPRFFSCSAPNNPTHPLLPWPQNPVLVAPAPWSVPTNDPTPVPKKTRENPWEPTWILQFLGVSSPIYVGPRTPSFFHWNFWGSKGFFDDSFLKCWKIRAYNFGEFQTEKKKTYRHTHTHFKKDIYIYTYIDIHTRAHTRIPSPENSQQN